MNAVYDDRKRIAAGKWPLVSTCRHEHASTYNVHAMPVHRVLQVQLTADCMGSLVRGRSIHQQRAGASGLPLELTQPVRDALLVLGEVLEQGRVPLGGSHSRRLPATMRRARCCGRV